MTATTKKKYVERELEDFSLPKSNHSIVKILKPRGNNLHLVTTSSGDEFLASMPPKFRKHIWIKRGDYVITEPIPEGQKVRAEIVKILTRDHVKHYAKENIWPAEFTDPSSSSKETEITSEDDEFLLGNPNKPPVFSESSDSDFSEEDENENSLSNDLGKFKLEAQSSIGPKSYLPDVT